MRSGRAKNVNTVDEVPDSSWYTNRAGSRPLTPEDVAKGPDTTDGPAAGTWTVTSSKSDGVTPGFTIKDANGPALVPEVRSARLSRDGDRAPKWR